MLIYIVYGDQGGVPFINLVTQNENEATDRFVELVLDWGKEVEPELQDDETTKMYSIEVDGVRYYTDGEDFSIRLEEFIV